MNKVLTYLTEGYTYAGLEICEVNGVEQFYFIEVKKQKGEVHLANKKKLSQLDELSELLPKYTPLFLTINTSKILTKKGQIAGNTNSEALVNQAFPNLNLQNFYYEIIQVPDFPIIIISKKKYVDGIIKKLNELSIKVFHFSLSVGTIAYVISFIEDESVFGSNYHIIKKNNRIEEINLLTEPVDKTYLLNGLELSSPYLLSFASILTYLISPEQTSNFGSYCRQLRMKVKNQRLFNYSIKFSLLFFLGLLLVNFFVFNHYYGKAEILNLAIEKNKSLNNNFVEKETSVKSKRERLESLLAYTSSKTTSYLDDLAIDMPLHILLSQVQYQPLSKPVRDLQPIELKSNVIIVSGISMDRKNFALWLEDLEAKDWISEVETLDYDYVKKKVSEFKISIVLNED